MIDFECSRSIGHPPSLVLAALTDLAYMPRWVPGLEKIRRDDRDSESSEPSGRAVEGTVWEETRMRFGRPMKERIRVAELGGDRLSLEVEGDEESARRGRYRFEYHLEETPEGCRLTVRGHGEELGTVGRVAGRFLVEPFQRSCREDLAALEAWLDTGTAG